MTVGGHFGDGGTANVHQKEPFPHSRTLIKIFQMQLAPSAREDFFAKIVTLAQRSLKLKQRLPMVAWPNAVLFKEKSATPDALIGCALPLVENVIPLFYTATDLETLQLEIPGATLDTLRLVALIATHLLVPSGEDWNSDLAAFSPELLQASVRTQLASADASLCNADTHFGPQSPPALP